MGGYCASVGGFWGGEFHSNLDRQTCQELTATKAEYEGILLFETEHGRAAGSTANSARAILQTVSLIEDKLESGETCLTLGAASPPALLVPPGLWGFAYRIIHGTWEFPAGTDIAYERLCTGWADELAQLNRELEAQLTWAGDTGRAETIGSISNTVANMTLTAGNVTDVGPGTWCENAPEVCGALKTAGWLLVAYLGFQTLKELR